jgi:hypothetical protein
MTALSLNALAAGIWFCVLHVAIDRRNIWMVALSVAALCVYLTIFALQVIK